MVTVQSTAPTQRRPKGGHLSNRGYCKALSGSEVGCITHGNGNTIPVAGSDPICAIHDEGVAFSDGSRFITPPMNQPPSLRSVV